MKWKIFGFLILSTCVVLFSISIEKLRADVPCDSYADTVPCPLEKGTSICTSLIAKIPCVSAEESTIYSKKFACKGTNQSGWNKTCIPVSDPETGKTTTIICYEKYKCGWKNGIDGKSGDCYKNEIPYETKEAPLYTNSEDCVKAP